MKKLFLAWVVLSFTLLLGCSDAEPLYTTNPFRSGVGSSNVTPLYVWDVNSGGNGDGSGDMLKAIYDPNEDAVIALAQLDTLVCSETEADGKITTHSGAVDPHADRVYTDSEVAGKDVGEGHIFILPVNYDSIGQGTWAIMIATGMILNSYFVNSSDANLDNITLKTYLQAGTYTLKTVYLKHTWAGILDIDIDGTEVESLDMYASSGAFNVVGTETNITVATSGITDIVLRVHGKNASSSGYKVPVVCLVLWRTE